ncbi:histidine phosphatase family protein [Gelidibacter salicanalis]|uniref:Histidine phosphatase family protein n=2 Tax=Gelidibacter salicanalis TaxID=291193 RepID=A0A5C7AGX5_9FLAO|nr:histidine phosphatase family protein [Gelidibacter salicanalis]
MGCKAQVKTNSDVTTYYFIRHAEKDRTDPTEGNPHLTEKGHERAQNWDTVLQHVTFDAVYSTDYYRTKQTGQPIADRNKLDLTIYTTEHYFDDVFQTATKGKTVLIVGHSNTSPEFVNAVLGRKKYDHMDDDNNGNLYIVTLNNGNVTDIVLRIN